MYVCRDSCGHLVSKTAAVYFNDKLYKHSTKEKLRFPSINTRRWKIPALKTARHSAVVRSKVTRIDKYLLSFEEINGLNGRTLALIIIIIINKNKTKGWGASCNTDLKSGSSKTVDPVNLSSGSQKRLHTGRVALRRRFCQLIFGSHCLVHRAAAIVSVGRLFWQVAGWCRFEEQEQLIKNTPEVARRTRADDEVRRLVYDHPSPVSSSGPKVVWIE